MTVVGPCASMAVLASLSRVLSLHGMVVSSAAGGCLACSHGEVLALSPRVPSCGAKGLLGLGAVCVQADRVPGDGQGP